MKALIAAVLVTAGFSIGCAYFLASARAAVERSVRERAALNCAKEAEGADVQIADCFLSRNLPVPGDL